MLKQLPLEYLLWSIFLGHNITKTFDVSLWSKMVKMIQKWVWSILCMMSVMTVVAFCSCSKLMCMPQSLIVIFANWISCLWNQILVMSNLRDLINIEHIEWGAHAVGWSCNDWSAYINSWHKLVSSYFNFDKVTYTMIMIMSQILKGGQSLVLD